MITFKKEKDPENNFDQTNITMEVNHIGINEIIDEFVCFLKACGYYPTELEKYISGEDTSPFTVVYVINGEESTKVYDTSKEARRAVNEFLQSHKDDRDSYWVDKIIRGVIDLDYDTLKDIDNVLEY